MFFEQQSEIIAAEKTGEIFHSNPRASPDSLFDYIILKCQLDAVNRRICKYNIINDHRQNHHIENPVFSHVLQQTGRQALCLSSCKSCLLLFGHFSLGPCSHWFSPFEFNFIPDKDKAATAFRSGLMRFSVILFTFLWLPYRYFYRFLPAGLRPCFLRLPHIHPSCPPD